MNERQKIKLTRAINAASHLRPAVPALIPNFQNLQPDGAMAVLTEDLDAMPHDSDPWEDDFEGLTSAAATLYLPSYDNDTQKVRWGEASDELKNIQVHNLTGDKFYDGTALWITQQYGAWLVRGRVRPRTFAVAHFGYGTSMNGSDFSNLIYNNPDLYPYPVLETGRAKIYEVCEDPDNAGDYIYLDITEDQTNGDVVVNITPWHVSSQYCYRIQKCGGLWVMEQGQDIAPYYEARIYTVTSGKATFLMDPSLPANEVLLNHGRYCTLVNAGGGICTQIKFLTGDALGEPNSFVYHIQGRVNVSSNVSSTAASVSSTVTATTSSGFADSSTVTYYSKDGINHAHFISFLARVPINDTFEIAVTCAASTGSLAATGRIQIIPVV